MSQSTPTSNDPIKLVLVDDHAIVRQGTREILNQNPHLCVVGECESGQELIGLLQLRQPDILLLDIHLPGDNGLILLQKLRPQFPELKIILFSAHDELPYLRKAEQLQANGFLSKTIDTQELQSAILAVAQAPLGSGMICSSDMIAKQASQVLNSKSTAITAREHEILSHLAQGLTNQAIAKALCLSVKTVDTHMANLIKKTSVTNRTQLLAYAYEHGLIS